MMEPRRTLPRPLISLVLGAGVLAASGAACLWPLGGERYLNDIRVAAHAGGPSLSDLKKFAAAMTLKDPDTSGSDARLVAFGRRLFFDPRLSSNQHISCASCHKPELFFTDGVPVASALARTTRNTPTVVNTFAQYWFFWDGRADSLAAQALQPLEDEREHGFTRSGVVRVISEHYRDEYQELFGAIPDELIALLPEEAMPLAQPPEFPKSVLQVSASSVTTPALLQRMAAASDPATEVLRMQPGEEPSARALQLAHAYEQIPGDMQTAVDRVFADVGLALAAWQETLVANESPFDHFIKGWAAAGAYADPGPYFVEGFGGEELLGLQIFNGKGGCNLCHTGAALSDHQFHNIGLPQRGDTLELGRSRGLALVLHDPFNCRAPFWPAEHAQSESCKDLAYLNAETPEAIGAFKTPGLRSVALTAPYMHDGRFKTLSEVIDHYDRMDSVSAVGFREETLRPLGLSMREKDALLAFLTSLTSPVREIPAGQKVSSP